MYSVSSTHTYFLTRMHLGLYVGNTIQKHLRLDLSCMYVHAYVRTYIHIYRLCWPVALAGVEDIFKTFRRLSKHGSENGIFSIDRLYDVGKSAAEVAWPNVMQEDVNVDDLERRWGKGKWGDLPRIVPKLGQNRRCLARSVFRTPTKSWLPKPSEADISMAPAAHSRQWAYEECLLHCQLSPEGTFVSTLALDHSWACRLVHSVSVEAIDLDSPTVLADNDGQAFLPVLELGRCLLAWPLIALCPPSRVLRLLFTELVVLIISDPCSARERLFR